MKFTKEQEELRARLIERLLMVDNADLLEEVRQILDQSESGSDFWNELSENQQTTVRKGLKELKEGRGIPATKVIEDLNQ